jgi:membrane fusion protein, copper/silver efflux system
MIRFGKTIAIILVVGLVLTGLSGVFISCQKSRNEAQAPGQKVIYHCPMHPNYLSDKPGSCPICGMNLVPVNGPSAPSGQTGTAPGKNERKILYYRDAMNPSHTSDKPGKAPDGMDMVPVYEGESGGESGEVKIDPTTVQSMGVATETVAKRDLKKEIRVSGTIDLNETEVSVVNTKIMGWVEKLFIDYTGQAVKKGQPLLTIYSPDLVSAQEEYLQALHYLKSLPEGAMSDARKGAEQLVESGKRRLLNWDIPDKAIAKLEERDAPEKAMTIYSPSDGVVLEKMVVAGQNVMPGMALYKVADLSVVWAIANAYEDDLPYVKLGAGATVEVSSVPGRTFEGTVQFVSPVLDPSTKTAAVRVSIRNTPDRLLKPQMFANVSIQSPLLKTALSVSQQAVIHTGPRNIVIVSLGNGYFKPREVTLGMSANGFVQVLTGLTAGQTIVTSSQFLIDSESNLKKAVSQMSGMDSTAPMPEKPADTSKEEKKRAPQENQKMNMPGM